MDQRVNLLVLKFQLVRFPYGYDESHDFWILDTSDSQNSGNFHIQKSHAYSTRFNKDFLYKEDIKNGKTKGRGHSWTNTYISTTVQTNVGRLLRKQSDINEVIKNLSTQ
jgi:hypothetical protein